MARQFTCRQCQQRHTLEPEEERGCLTSPWTRRCTCQARYQITKTEIRLIEWGGNYRPLPKLPPLPALPPLPPLPLILPVINKRI